MKFVTVLAAMLVAVSATAQQPPPHDSFPSDYTPSACAPNVACKTFRLSGFPSAGARFFGFNMNLEWIQTHDAEMKAAFAPYCTKLATCLATPNNLYAFCTDVISAKARSECGKLFPASKSATDNEQCREYTEVYWQGVDQEALRIWKEAQECAAKQPPVAHPKPPIVWMVPDVVPLHYKGYVQFFALDPDTHVPLYGDISIENQIIYAEANPAGNMATYYPFKIPFKYQRSKNAAGHTDAVPPMVTLQVPGYPTVKFRLDAKVPTVRVEMTPGVQSLKPGANPVTITATEVENGKPIDARVMVGDDEVGYVNSPITITLPNGKRPEIWVKPFLDSYSDVVIAPAE